MSSDPRKERKRLEAQPANVRAAEAQAAELGRKLADAKQSITELLKHARHDWAINGPTPERTETVRQLEAELAAFGPEEEKVAALLAATADARRGHQRELHQLLKDEMATFRADAEKLAHAAETDLRALALAMQKAARSWAAARAEWQVLSVPMRELLRERDEAAGIHRDPGHYVDAARPPVFPLPAAALATPCRPAAVGLLDQPAKVDQAPPVMRRVA